MVSTTPTVTPSSARVDGARTRPVLFVVLAYAISWAWVIPLAVLGLTVVEGRGWPTHLPAVLGPMLAALLCAALAGRPALRDLVGRMLHWRIGWRWWVAAVTPALALLAVIVVLALVGAPLPAASGFARFSGIPAGWGVLGVAAVIVVVDGMGEETGWRGYLQPALQRRFGPLPATGIVAAVWAGWHAPQFFLISSYENVAVAALPIFLVGLAGGSVVLTWLYNHTRSVPACALWHGLYNVAGGTAAAAAGAGVIAAGVWTFVVGFAVVLLVLEWRARRGGRPSVLAPTAAVTGPLQEWAVRWAQRPARAIASSRTGDAAASPRHQDRPATAAPAGPPARRPDGRRVGEEGVEVLRSRAPHETTVGAAEENRTAGP